MMAIFLLGSCASSQKPGGSASIDIPAPVPADLDSTAAAVARAAGIRAGELALLEPGPPRILSGGVLFSLPLPSANTVFVAGTFNGWVPNQYELVRRDGRVWVGVIPVPRGRHLYKFLIDGRRWILDPANPDRGRDGTGGDASVLFVP